MYQLFKIWLKTKNKKIKKIHEFMNIIWILEYNNSVRNKKKGNDIMLLIGISIILLSITTFIFLDEEF